MNGLSQTAQPNSTISLARTSYIFTHSFGQQPFTFQAIEHQPIYLRMGS